MLLETNVVGELKPKRTAAASRGFPCGNTAFLFEFAFLFIVEDVA